MCSSPTLCLNAQQNYIFQEAKLTCVSTKVYNTSEATDIGIFGAILEPEQWCVIATWSAAIFAHKAPESDHVEQKTCQLNRWTITGLD